MSKREGSGYGRWAARGVVPLLALLLLLGCSSQGPNRVPPDRFNYNEAIASSSREQMLLNMLRLRYLEEPSFLAVGSVTTQYTYEASGEVAASTTGAGLDLLRGTAGGVYVERPTITYTPIVGEDFSHRLMSRVPLEFFFALGQAGWPTDLLMQVGLQRIGEVENMSFGPFPTPGDIDRERQFREDLDRLRRFQYVIGLMLELFEADAIEVQRREEGDRTRRFFVFDSQARGSVKATMDLFKAELGLDPDMHEFRITQRYARRGLNDLTIQPRSVFAIMSFLARGTEIPAQHRDEGWVVPMEVETDDGVGPPPIPFRIRSAAERPASAFATVQYRGYWFYIDNADIQSKRLMLLMSILFRLQAPAVKTQAPILTLPAGP